ncbi:RagB/SusD family nutrient uptake outer membrane protein [Marinilongibacter aquaticus]|uniref:RagB/SusD family nutrient uptake outer membrane protein n=1 Tax=Marinilongibacter aquaticus TaxID=2975157 RepID=UPI0021BD10F2|nr:RagB/SusD family nutrient uptake outer membrane protein [Marinilongibacter aquaticus]UBM59973.1 RagB/SusD family nutrient uptake outer membrane protein [Marinilongibacter aquaticus]
MKKILLIFSIALLSFSCEDALKESPKSLAVETFYNTNAEVEAALGAIYEALRNGDAMGALYPAQLEAYTDYSYGRGSYGVLSTFQGLDGNNEGRIQSMWNKFYLAIRNANIVIANVPEGSQLTEEDKMKYIAEAKYLRALVYFIMVRNWDGVPIRTESNMTELEIKRNTAEEVYQLIFDDLDYAENNLPDMAPISGRPSLWAAKTLLADVYFYRQEYAEARDKANEVIQSGKYDLVPVSTVEDYDNVFGPTVVTTAEEIFYLKYSHLGTGQGWWFVQFIHHPGTGFYGGGGYYAHYSDLVSNSVMANMDPNDLRFQLWYKWDIGLGPNTVLSKKFSDPDAAGGGSTAGNDYPMYRYADVLLIYAEAEARASNAVTESAVENLNIVHRRAYGKEPHSPSEVDFVATDYSVDDFVELVIQERGYETQMEAKRWLDLKRTGQLKERIKAATGIDVADKHLLWPIPNSELNFNSLIDPATDQNPGY